MIAITKYIHLLDWPFSEISYRVKQGTFLKVKLRGILNFIIKHSHEFHYG